MPVIVEGEVASLDADRDLNVIPTGPLVKGDFSRPVFHRFKRSARFVI